MRKKVNDCPQTLRDRNRSWIVGAASRNASRDGYLHKELGKVQHRLHRGPGWFVGREKLRILLVVRRKVLAFGQMREHGQDIIQRGPRGFQNHFDAFDGVSGLFANVSADPPLIGCRPV